MSKTRVLAIDDEQLVLDSVKKVLEPDGFEVVTATESPKGLEIALSESFDLVITDIRMPVIGGMRVLRDVKRAKPSVPVMIFTGYATVQSAVQAMKLGAADFIEKPFTPDMLVTTVKRVLDQAGTAEPDPQEVVHRDEIIRVLERAAVDSEFVVSLLYNGAEALEDYELTGPEKLAILTADVKWIQDQVGSLTPDQKKWLDQRLNAEIW